MTPAEALVRALERIRDLENHANDCACRCYAGVGDDAIAGAALAAFRSWLTNEAVETVAKAMVNADEESIELTDSGWRDLSRAALRAIFGELAP